VHSGGKTLSGIMHQVSCIRRHASLQAARRRETLSAGGLHPKPAVGMPYNAFPLPLRLYSLAAFLHSSFSVSHRLVISLSMGW
jgi:hypothetical protein